MVPSKRQDPGKWRLIWMCENIIRQALAQGVSDHRFFVFIATFVTCVKQLLHFRLCCNTFGVCLSTFEISAIVVVHCSDKCCLLSKKRAREGGLSGSLWAEAYPGITSHCSLQGHLFHIQFCALPFAPKITILTKNMFPEWCTNPFKM